MSFTGNENHDIPLSEAAALTANYRKSHPGAILGEYFSKKALIAILEQSECVGARIYFGEDENRILRMVITGVTENQNDLYNGLLAEKGWQCPPYCSTENPLNS